jgi:hypothetical protein
MCFLGGRFPGWQAETEKSKSSTKAQLIKKRLKDIKTPFFKICDISQK